MVTELTGIIKKGARQFQKNTGYDRRGSFEEKLMKKGSSLLNWFGVGSAGARNTGRFHCTSARAAKCTRSLSR